MADTGLTSLDGHQWYLNPTLVVFALSDEGLPNERRQVLGSAPADADRPQICAPEQPRNDATVSTKRLALDKAVPRLAQSVSSRPLLMFGRLQMTSADMVWLHEDLDVWRLRAEFQTFREFVDVVVVSDLAERRIY